MKKTSNNRFTKTLCALALTLLITPSLTHNSAANDRKIYACDAIGDGNYFVNISGENSRDAYAVYSLGGDLQDINNSEDRIVLQTQFSGYEFNYTSKDVQFVGVDKLALLIDLGSKSVVQCKLETSAQQPRSLNAAGFALGGKVRSGPGLNFSQIGSVRSKEAITILENSGVTMDGYDWFKVQRPNGQVGYQWGGILCADDKSIKGIFEQCL